LKVPGCW